MKTTTRFAAVVCALVLASAGLAQEQATVSVPAEPQAGSGTTVPRLIQFSGAVKASAGTIPTGTMSLTFSLYELEEGSTPLWAETQKVQLDGQGHYSVLLGATQPGGLPLEVFTSGKALWLGVQPQLPGEGEQTRVLLVAVPYALKAADADTLGGKPASAYITTETISAPGSTIPASAASTIIGLQAPAPALSAPQVGSAPSGTNPLTSPCVSITADGTAKANFIAKFTAACQIHQSALFENGGNVGIGNTTPAGKLDVSGNSFIRGTLQLPATGTATSSVGFNSQALDSLASAYNSGTHAAVNQHFRWQAEPVGNNTASPSGKFNLLFASGTGTPAETGVSISAMGNLTGKQLISSVATGAAPLVVSSTTQVANLNASQLGGLASSAFAKVGGANTFNGNQSVTGNVSSTKQLVSTVATGTAPLVVSSTTQVANLNASLLGGLTAGSFAKLSSNIFTGNQTIQSGVLAVNTTTPLSISTMEADVNAPGVLGPVLSLVNVGGGLNAAAAVDFKTYGEVGSPYNPGARIEAVDVGNYGDNIVFLLNNPGAPSNGLAEVLRLTPGGLVGINQASGSGKDGTPGIVATGGAGDPGNPFNGGDGVDAYGGASNEYFAGVGVSAVGGTGRSCSNCGGDGIHATAGGPATINGPWAGNFTGDINVSGAINAGVKDFKIDHPLDPANRYLVHSSVESSEMMDIYTGNVTLDPNGAATVQLPAWFETLNADFRYQLTAIGAPAPNLHIAQEVANRQFGIAGGVPGMKVSWQITGVRHDAFALAHPLTVEVDKPASERGYYIHPELYGAPGEKQIEWARHPEAMKRMKAVREKADQRAAR